MFNLLVTEIPTNAALLASFPMKGQEVYTNGEFFPFLAFGSQPVGARGLLLNLQSEITPGRLIQGPKD